MAETTTTDTGPLGPGAVPEGTYLLRILVVRPDRIGDVLLSTPVFDVIKRHYARSRLSVMVRQEVSPIVRGLPSVDEVFIYEPLGKHAGVRGFFRLVSEIKAKRFKIAVVLQTHWRIALAIYLARVRYRVGPLSKLHSFLLFNRGLRQHRSHVEMHEADYNLQLLRRIGIRVGTRNVETKVEVSEEGQQWARTWLAEQGWKGGPPLVAVHPGMGGSALNWPETYYLELIRMLARDGRKVLVTGGETETALIARFRGELASGGGFKETPIYYTASKADGIDCLAGLYAHCDLVVAPSTGPMHLAVALGKPVVTFFPPIRVQSAIRWGPYVRDESKASILVPEIYCGEDFKCRGSLCNYFPCMKTLTVVQAHEQVCLQLARRMIVPDDGKRK
jgi:ADP-heptose:LPS heptosyltransferase